MREKVAVVGSREYPDLEAVHEYVCGLPPDTVVVSGGARGVDSKAHASAKESGLNVEIYYPRWDLHGRAAGIYRNMAIVQAASRVVVFWDGSSRGAAHVIEYCKRIGKEFVVVLPRSEP